MKLMSIFKLITRLYRQTTYTNQGGTALSPVFRCHFIGLAGCCLLVLGFNGSALAGSGPEVINVKDVFEVHGKKKAAMLPHHTHQAKVACAACHISPGGGGSVKFDLVKKSGVGNDFHKKWCWPCHEEMNVPKGKSCSTCHTGPK